MCSFQKRPVFVTEIAATVRQQVESLRRMLRRNEAKGMPGLADGSVPAEIQSEADMTCCLPRSIERCCPRHEMPVGSSRHFVVV